MRRYNPNKIEKKWQDKWYGSDAFRAKNPSLGSQLSQSYGGQAGQVKSPKFYVLIEFPYPSGDGLHVGHCRSFIAFDAIARKKRMQGFNVLYPIGWDAFGLPTENYAIKNGVHPSVVTKKNTDNFRRQMKSLGLSFDWSREINTTSPQYYKWTQWIFVQLFKQGLAYKDKIAINWCSSCKIGLANEEVVFGKCERCDTKVEKKEKEQWMIKITKYANRLINDLNLVDYPERVKSQQRDWIGKSEGALVRFPLEGVEDFVEVFTTRIDTIFSGTFLILSPGHKLIDKYKDKIKNWNEVLEYRETAKNISDIDKTNKEKEITGVELKGIMVKNPATGEEMPVWTADFVLEYYGTGAVFADAHDNRDFKMAKKYGLPLKTSIRPDDNIIADKVKNLEECFEGEGILYNSMQFDGLTSAVARPQIISWLNLKGFAKTKTSYKLRDWVFSRQHYWGEPIPMIFCKDCGWVAVPEKDLPVELPKVKKYQPTDTGESPIALIKKWVNTKCPKCKGLAQRETDTMPNWAGSNWYYLAYTMLGNQRSKRNKFLASESKNQKYDWNKKNIKYWLPVDWYNGGMEHTTLHLLYSRFIFKFLWDIGAVPKQIGPEPYKKRTSHGMVLGEGGTKMSKSKGNVINPDKIVKEYGADTLRGYEMFMGPFDQMVSWDTKGVVGVRRFLEKVYRLVNTKIQNPNAKLNPKFKIQNNELKKLLHKTIKKVSEDIDLMKFNTAVSSLMEFTNVWQISQNTLERDDLADFLTILSPFAPHLTEELWEKSGFKGFCSNSKWPKYDSKLIIEESVPIIVQINGRVRDKIEVNYNIKQKEAEKFALNSLKIKNIIGGKKIKKIIFIQNRLINIVL